MGPVSVSSMFFHEYRTDEIFDFAAEAGLSGIEFWIETPHFWLRGFPEQEILAAQEAAPAISSLTVHAPILDLNPCSINPKVAEATLYYAAESVRVADRLFASVITMHPGRRTAKRPPSGPDYVRFDRYIGTLRDLARNHCVRIAMENMEPAVNSLLCTPAGMRELLDEERWLGFTLDVTHARAGSDTSVSEYLRLCGDRLLNVHMSRPNGPGMHFPIDGDLPSRKILEELEEQGYSGPITLEIEDRNFTSDLSSEEKITILARELAYIRESLQ